MGDEASCWPTYPSQPKFELIVCLLSFDLVPCPGDRRAGRNHHGEGDADLESLYALTGGCWERDAGQQIPTHRHVDLVFLHTHPPWAELLLKSRSTPRTGCRDEEGWDPLSWNLQAGHRLSPAHKESMQ